jgi:hypothetical protein
VEAGKHHVLRHNPMRRAVAYIADQNLVTGVADVHAGRFEADGLVKNKAVYVALALNPDGEKDVLGLWIEQTEGAKFWLKVVNELKARGVNDILIAVVDGLKGFPDAITSVFPQTVVQTCIVQVTRHHRFLLQLHLQKIDGLDASLGMMDSEIEANLSPFRIAVEIVSTRPGISKLSAQAIVSEIGTDMSRFPTAGHLLSWACMCPRNDESAGKRRSNRLRKGAQWLKTTVVQCAHAAKNKKGSYHQAQYLRLRSRRGPQKAICAVAASIFTALYNMLKNGTVYQDLGADHFNRRSKITHTQHLVKRLEKLGYTVEIQPLAA